MIVFSKYSSSLNLSILALISSRKKSTFDNILSLLWNVHNMANTYYAISIYMLLSPGKNVPDLGEHDLGAEHPVQVTDNKHQFCVATHIFRMGLLLACFLILCCILQPIVGQTGKNYNSYKRM